MSGVRLHYEWNGPPEAPVVVLANSLGTTTALWEPQLTALTARWRVLRYDHRGHGRSEVPPGPYTIAGLSRDVLGLFDRLGLETVSFCGVSLGAMVGMWMAAQEPARVDRLVLCCTSAYFGPEGWHERAARVRAAGTGSVVDAVVERWFTAPFRQRQPGVVAAFTDMLAATPAEGYAACCEAIAAMDLRPALSRVAAPTLVVAGADDPASPVRHAEEIAELLPGARLEVVGGAAHLASVEQAEAVTGLLIEHLSN